MVVSAAFSEDDVSEYSWEKLRAPVVMIRDEARLGLRLRLVLEEGR
jgi:hypothetical protein